MIVRALLVAVFLLVAWSLFVSVLPEELGWEAPLWNENVTAGQDFLYGDPVAAGDIVVLGSSLAERLPLDSLAGRPVTKLTFGGQGVQDGLALLEATGTVPGVVLVEANLLNLPPNPAFAKTLLHPVGRSLNRYVPAFRQGNQPATVLMGGLYYLKNGPPTTDSVTVDNDRPVNEAMLDLRRADYAVPFPEEELRTELGAVRKQLEVLRKRGARVIFFELPVHPALCGTVRTEGMRSAVRAIFPSPDYVLLGQPDCAAFLTTDGHHLRPVAARRYASLLDRELREILR